MDDELTSEEIRWVRESAARAKRCQSQVADIVVSSVKYLVVVSFGAAGLLLIIGAREWITQWLNLP